MVVVEEIGPGRADLRKQRLAHRHPELRPDERQQVLQYCERFETAAWLVCEGGVEIQAGAACRAEQFRELDISQIDRALSRAMHVDTEVRVSPAAE